MQTMRSMLLLVTVAAGCATDPVDPATDPGPPVDESAWPCASTTTWASGTQTLQTYEWDERHNLVGKHDDHGEWFAWTFDPTGTIALVETHVYPQDAHTMTDTTRRDVEGGRVMTERWTHLIDGSEDSSRTTTFRYESGRLVEKHGVGSRDYDVRTEVWYEAPASRGEIDRDPAGTLLATRSWNGEPWTVMHSIGTDRSVDTIVTRRLDDQGRELHREQQVYHSDPTLFVDIERRADGAPIREVWIDKSSPAQSRTITYQTACPE